MDRLERFRLWCSAHLAWAFDFLRIYVGAALCIKGIWFALNDRVLSDMVRSVDLPYAGIAVTHYVVLAHLAGGFALAIGLVTRLAAVVQLPILFGAVFFVHAHERLFSVAPNLELAALVGVMLVVYTVFGAGPLSVDALLHKRTEAPAQGGRPAMV